MSKIRYALGIEYDGSHYHGWQRQNHSSSVQETLENALFEVAGSPVGVVCAGRTDTGVHALGQVVHLDAPAPRPEKAWVMGGNTALPESIAVRWARQVDAEFHARFSARSRHYRYVIFNAAARPAILGRRVTWIKRSLDAEIMHQAAQALLGEHDFSSYRALACQAKHPVRRLQKISVKRHGVLIYLDIQANAFLHHMVRNIAGVLIAIGKGERPVSWAATVLAHKDRTQGGVTAPPYGLFLTAVEYPEHFAIPRPEMEIAFHGDV